MLPKNSTYQLPNTEVAGRFMSVDPHAENYYDVSPYAYVMNNPIKYIDPDGRDAVSTIDEKKHTITLSTTVYAVGASQDFVDKLNKKSKEVFHDGKYKDEDGNEWTVSFDVNYVASEGKDRKDLKDGENILDFNSDTDRSHVNAEFDFSGKLVEYLTGETGEMSNKSRNNIMSVRHETGHFLGLSDRYEDDPEGGASVSHEGYNNDLMGNHHTADFSSGNYLHQTHYDNFGSQIIKRSTTVGKQVFEQTRFLDKRPGNPTLVPPSKIKE